MAKDRDIDEIAESYHELENGSIFFIGGESPGLSVVKKSDDISDNLQERIDETDPDLNRDKYTINREVSRGGMGVILEVEDTELKRILAMKVLKESSNNISHSLDNISELKNLTTNPKILRFIREARITGRLEHPNIIPIHDLGIDNNNRPYFTMKMIKGKTLTELIHNKDKSYSLKQLLNIFIQCCNSISYAHSKNIIHRDIKSDNIMVGEYGEVLVLDWGLAKVEGEKDDLLHLDMDISDIDETCDGTIIGSPKYMSPEQALGDVDNIDRRSDIFSLGAVLFEILNKATPYNGKSAKDVINKAINYRIDQSLWKKTVQKELKRICLKALHRDKDHRYHNINELTDDLQAYLDNRVIPQYSLSIGKIIRQDFLIFLLMYISLLLYGDFKISNTGMFWDMLSFLIITTIGLLFQFICSGGNSILQRGKDDCISTLFSIHFQNGVFIGGFLGFIPALFLILSMVDSDDISTIGYYYGVGLLSIFYTFWIFLYVRLSYIRKARKLSLFEIISPFNVIEILKMSLLFSVFVIFMFLLVPIMGIPRNTFLELLDWNQIIVYLFIMLLTSSIISVTYFLMVFRLNELFTALSHFFVSISGGEVESINKIHSASVLRFLTEAQFLITSTYSMMRIIAQLVQLNSASEVFNYLFPVILCCFFSYGIYIFMNFIIKHFLASTSGFIETNNQLTLKLVKHMKIKSKVFWLNGTKGKIKISILFILFILSTYFIYYMADIPIISFPSLISLLILSVMFIAALHINKKLKNLYNTL